MATPLRVISSMATQQILNDLVAQYQTASGQAVRVESVGGVDAAKRVHAGEEFDVVVLARNAMDQLQGASKLVQGTLCDLVISGVAVAVASGSAHPDITSEGAVKQAVLNASTLGYSTGPSGVQLASLFERWGIADSLKDRIVQAPPGVPVGALIAKGEVALGFQQLSELLNVNGVDVVGMLPKPIAIATVFSGAVASTCNNKAAASALLAFMATPQNAEIIRQNGMDPALGPA